MALIPCPSCDRHIRDDVRCPFCHAPRAGVLAATVLAVGAASCGGAKKPADSTPPPAATVDAGTEADAPAAATKPPDDDGSHVRPLYGVDRR